MLLQAIGTLKGNTFWSCNMCATTSSCLCRFMGTAMFHSMVARARASDSEIVVLLDPILVLLQDFSLTVNKMRTTSGNWLLVASPISTSIFPFDLQGPSELWVRSSDGIYTDDEEVCLGEIDFTFLQKFTCENETHGKPMIAVIESSVAGEGTCNGNRSKAQVPGSKALGMEHWQSSTSCWGYATFCVWKWATQWVAFDWSSNFQAPHCCWCKLLLLSSLPWTFDRPTPKW